MKPISCYIQCSGVIETTEVMPRLKITFVSAYDPKSVVSKKSPSLHGLKKGQLSNIYAHLR